MATKHEFNEPTVDASLRIGAFGVEGGQSFTIGTTGVNENFDITSVFVKIFKEGSPGTVTCEIFAVDGSSLPTGAALSSGTMDGDTLGTSTNATPTEFTMSSYELQASTQYALVLSIVGGDGSNNIEFESDEASGSTYAGGKFLIDDGGWFEDEYDSWFQVWGDAVVTATIRKIKISGSFADKPIKTKVSGSFEDKPIKIKVGGSFQDA